jgi:hypothetical protein
MFALIDQGITGSFLCGCLMASESCGPYETIEKGPMVASRARYFVKAATEALTSSQITLRLVRDGPSPLRDTPALYLHQEIQERVVMRPESPSPATFVRFLAHDVSTR